MTSKVNEFVKDDIATITAEEHIVWVTVVRRRDMIKKMVTV